MPSILADLLRSAPGLVLLGVVPGLAVATLVAPRRSWALRAAAAPGLSAGLIGIVGLVLHDLHIPFELATVLPIVAVVAAAAAIRARREPTRPMPLAHRRGVAAALVVGLATAAALAFAFAGQQVSVAGDAPVHGAFAAAIAHDHDTLAVVPVPVEQSGQVRPRTGFEAEAALVQEIGGPEAARAMVPIALLAVALIPLGLAVLLLETTGSALLAGVAPALGAGMIFPAFPMLFGEFPLVVGSTLIVPTVVAVVAVVGTGASRAELGLLAACVAAQWVVHGTEVLTAATVGGALVLSLVVRMPLRQSAARLAAVAVAAGSGALLVSLLTRLPRLPAGGLPVGAGSASTTTDLYGASIAHTTTDGALTVARGFLLPTAAAIVLYAVGVTAVLLSRRNRWMLVAQALMLAAYLDVVAWGHLRRLWVALFPWSTDDRLLSIEYWVLPALMAYGAMWAVGELRRLRWQRLGERGVVGVVGAAIAIPLLATGVTSTARDYRGLADSAAIVDDADASVLAAMAAHLPANATVASDGADAGQWVGVLNGDRLYFSKEYIQDFDSDARLLLLDRACQVTPDQSAARLFTGIDAVFVGSRQPSTAPHRWDATCLSRISWLRPVAVARSQNGLAAAFAVDPALIAGSPTATAQQVATPVVANP